jgi:hypothetical protein
MRGASLDYRAREAFGEWSKGFPWDVFATLTFAGDEVASTFAVEEIKKFLRSVARDRIGGHFWYELFADLQRRGVLHFHVLLGALAGDPRRITPQDLDGLWRWGNVKADPYDRRGAAFYGVHGHRHWDINVVCPRHPECTRRKGCLFAPGPWPTPNELKLN